MGLLSGGIGIVLLLGVVTIKGSFKIGNALLEGGSKKLVLFRVQLVTMLTSGELQTIRANNCRGFQTATRLTMKASEQRLVRHG